MNLPLKETLLIFSLIALGMSLNQLQLKDSIVRDITAHPWVRFLIIFMSAFLIFNFNIENKYSIPTQILVSVFIAFVVQTFLAANTTLLTFQ